jgi:hypothetical protein
MEKDTSFLLILDLLNSWIMKMTMLNHFLELRCIWHLKDSKEEDPSISKVISMGLGVFSTKCCTEKAHFTRLTTTPSLKEFATILHKLTNSSQKSSNFSFLKLLKKIQPAESQP